MSEAQTIKSFLICPCGEKATIGYAFPGQGAERGLCDLHEKTVEMRRELSPGRAEVASVRRLDGPPPVQKPVQLVSESANAGHGGSAGGGAGGPADLERELKWTKSELSDAREALLTAHDELSDIREQLAEARQALEQHTQPTTVDGQTSGT